MAKMELSLAYTDEGHGLPVVLIHGYPLNRQMWRPQIEALSEAGCRIIRPDLLGFGASPAIDGPVTMSTYADTVIKLLDQLGVDRAVIGGMSMGGYVLLDLLDRYPERFHAAMFLVTRAAADDPAGKQKRSELAASVQDGDRLVVPETFAQVLFAPTTPDERPELVAEVRDWMEATSPEGLAGGLLAMRDRADYVDRLPEFDLPALVIGAEFDIAVPVAHARVLADGLPNATLEIIPGAGHMVNLEQPELFNRVVLDFLETVKGS